MGKTIIDIGAGVNSCRGDICYIYAFDKSVDNVHTQYNGLYPLRNGEKRFYKSVYDIMPLVYYDITNNKTQYIEFLFLHSFEHNYSFFILLEHIINTMRNEGVKGKITIIAPNSRTNNADLIDSGHLFSFTEWSLKNLLNYFNLKNVNIRLLMGDLDIMGQGEII